MQIFNLSLRLLSFINIINVINSWQFSPPKLSLLSHTINGDTIDIKTNSIVHMNCTGEKPMVWIFPNNEVANYLLLPQFVL